ncbi:unnamed protein product [Gulo gulo]|uniref:Uncharacterized protein n=1 Tax=Gulo gulo TaxID=48420 RepID=A0A9X9Q418_GULGU|nr:unnamed protein product [Gulo gulo]
MEAVYLKMLYLIVFFKKILKMKQSLTNCIILESVSLQRIRSPKKTLMPLKPKSFWGNWLAPLVEVIS